MPIEPGRPCADGDTDAVQTSQAFWWSIATSMPQPLVAVPSFVFVTAFRALLPVALGFAAGCMVWMVFAELLPDALEDAAHGKARRSQGQGQG